VSDRPLDYLAATDQVLESFGGLEHEYFGAALMRRGLERQRERVILDRLGAMQPSSEALDLALFPQFQPSGGVEVSLLSSVLSSLQEAVLAIAQSVREEPTLHGPVTANIQEAVRLRVQFALPGSLRLRLVPASPDLQQATLLDDDQETLLDESVKSLLGLLESTVDANVDAILERLAAVGPRAATHLVTLTSALDRGNAGLGLGWRSPHDTRSVRVSRAQSVQLNAVLKQVTTAERELIVQGRLVGGSLVRRVFELEIGDGTVLSGKVDETVLGSIEDLFGSECTADLIVTEVSLPTGETRESYRLRRLTG
jgi:hypothetical protein